MNRLYGPALSRRRLRTLGIVAGYLADRAWGDPRRGHPVAAFGRIATYTEKRIWSDSTWRGAVFSVLMVAGTGSAAFVVDRIIGRHVWMQLGLTAAATWVALGGRSLGNEGAAVRDSLQQGDIDVARRQLTHLVGRDTSRLDEAQICRAVVESVAENTSDAVVAPLLAGSIAGMPGILVYRAANTLDAMVGHRDARYRRFGWASARLDDVLNLVPARATAVLAVLLAPSAGGSALRALRAWRTDAHRHPSPNAGPVEATFAGALGVQLGGVNTYRDRTENRHTLGDGPAPGYGDIARSIQLSDRVAVSCLALLTLIGMRTAVWPNRRRRTHRGSQ